MLADVEPDDLVLLAYPQRHKNADQLEDAERRDAGPRGNDDDAVELRPDEMNVALDQALDAVRQIGRGGNGAD